MQIVIDIQDDVYRVLKEDIYPIPDTERLALVFKTLVKKGTPLPKGHGRLFDERDIVNGNYEVIGNRIYELEPIIEADREGKDERQGL